MSCSVLELASPFDTCLTRRYEGGVGPPTKANSVTETPDRAEAIVFKCHKKKSSPDMIAKIKFQMTRLEPVATDTTRH